MTSFNCKAAFSESTFPIKVEMAEKTVGKTIVDIPLNQVIKISFEAYSILEYIITKNIEEEQKNTTSPARIARYQILTKDDALYR